MARSQLCEHSVWLRVVVLSKVYVSLEGGRQAANIRQKTILDSCLVCVGSGPDVDRHVPHGLASSRSFSGHFTPQTKRVRAVCISVSESSTRWSS